MMHRPRRSQHCGTTWRETQSHQIVSGDLERGLSVGLDSDDAALAREGGGYVEISVVVERETLRASQAAEKVGDGAVRVDAVDRIEARRGRPGHEEIPTGIERKVISRDARFERGENEGLPIARNLEDGSAAVADVKILRAVKSDPGRNPHALGVGRHGAVRSHTVDRPIVARGNVHLTLAVEGD